MVTVETWLPNATKQYRVAVLDEFWERRGRSAKHIFVRPPSNPFFARNSTISHRFDRNRPTRWDREVATVKPPDPHTSYSKRHSKRNRRRARHTRSVGILHTRRATFNLQVYRRVAEPRVWPERTMRDFLIFFFSLRPSLVGQWQLLLSGPAAETKTDAATTFAVCARRPSAQGRTPAEVQAGTGTATT